MATGGGIVTRGINWGHMQVGGGENTLVSHFSCGEGGQGGPCGARPEFRLQALRGSRSQGGMGGPFSVDAQRCLCKIDCALTQ